MHITNKTVSSNSLVESLCGYDHEKWPWRFRTQRQLCGNGLEGEDGNKPDMEHRSHQHIGSPWNQD